VSLSHNSLQNIYKTNFGLVQHHKYNLTELENMMQWERQVYIELLLQFLEEEKEREQQRAK